MLSKFLLFLAACATALDNQICSMPDNLNPHPSSRFFPAKSADQWHSYKTWLCDSSVSCGNSMMRLRGGKRGRFLKHAIVSKQRKKDADWTHGLSHFGGEELVVPYDISLSLSQSTAGSARHDRFFKKRENQGTLKERQTDLQLWNPLLDKKSSPHRSGAALDSDLKAAEYAELCHIINSLNTSTVVDIGSGPHEISTQCLDLSFTLLAAPP
jgi:hypothetical protein